MFARIRPKGSLGPHRVSMFFAGIAVALLVAALYAPPTLAGRNAGGALIVHTNDAYTWKTSTVCTTTYATPASCEEAITRSDKSEGTVVWLLAAFPDSSNPGVSGIYFGIDYDDVNLTIADWKRCGTGGMEIPDDDWPYQGRGNSVAFTTPIVGNHLFPLYAFVIDGGTDSSSFSAAINPTGGYAAFIDDSASPETDLVTQFGTVRWYAEGESDCPSSGDQSEGDSQEWAGEDDRQGWGEQEESGGDSQALTFIQISTDSEETFAPEARDLSTTYGIRTLVTMSPDGIVCRASLGQREALGFDPRVSLVTDQAIPELPDVTAGDLEPGDPGFAARVWNSMLTRALQDSIASQSDMAPGDPCLSYEEQRWAPPVAPEDQTSVYMLGDIGVTMIFVESDSTGPCVDEHSPEDWSAYEKLHAYDRITYGLARLADVASAGNARFQLFPQPKTIGCSSEPIRYAQLEPTWVCEVMDSLGYETGTDVERMRTYCNTMRAQHDPPYDWWFIIFVIDDSCDAVMDPDSTGRGCFRYGGLSTGAFYGPCERLLYYNGVGEIQNSLDWIAFHETCHVFGAPDEYMAWGTCEDPWGYLRVPNGNRVGCIDSLLTRPCAMRFNNNWSLCSFTRAHLGCVDSDIPPDQIFDPIDHPKAHRSMLIGEADSVGLGDYVDIYDANNTWVKRLIATDWNVDCGRMLWDGIRYDGDTCSSGTYTWRRNGGAPDTLSLTSDTEAPAITDFLVKYGAGEPGSDTLRFRFVDPDSHGGRVRATASQQIGDTLAMSFVPKVIIRDKFFADTETGPAVVSEAVTLERTGLWAISLRVWDVGGGSVADTTIMRDTGGLGDLPAEVKDLNLSPGKPNPSGDWMVWDLRVRSARAVSFCVVGVDGRRVRSWQRRLLPGGITRIFWDGRDDGASRVASGKYFLLVSDDAGARASGCATIVR
jgi:hypothetical protein